MLQTRNVELTISFEVENFPGDDDMTIRPTDINPPNPGERYIHSIRVHDGGRMICIDNTLSLQSALIAKLHDILDAETQP